MLSIHDDIVKAHNDYINAHADGNINFIALYLYI